MTLRSPYGTLRGLEGPQFSFQYHDTTGAPVTLNHTCLETHGCGQIIYGQEYTLANQYFLNSNLKRIRAFICPPFRRGNPKLFYNQRQLFFLQNYIHFLFCLSITASNRVDQELLSSIARKLLEDIRIIFDKEP